MKIYRLNHQDVLEVLPDRLPDTHKGNYGKILLLCGSRGYTGAASLAAMGALRSGAGLVFLAVPESIYSIEAVKLLEPVVIPVDDCNGAYAPDADFQKLMQGKDCVLIGPGIGRSAGAESAVRQVLQSFPGPVVLDADGINLIGQHKNIVRGRMGTTVLTPHEGEFIRLGGNLSLGRQNAAVEMAKDLHAVVVLKGNHTIITDGDRIFENTTGNPGMAVGGSGDILAGIISSLLGQGLNPLDAAACGVWLHGAAGDLCAKSIGQYGMLPSDLLLTLPRLMK